jgi:hypothetical protein
VDDLQPSPPPDTKSLESSESQIAATLRSVGVVMLCIMALQASVRGAGRAHMQAYMQV